MATNILFAFIGLLLLTLGRRLFWFFVAAVGMTVGIDLAQQQMTIQPYWMVLLVGLAAGIVGALLAIFFQKAAIIVAGLLSGSAIAARLTMMLGFTPAGPWITMFGGILGAVLLYWLFDWALIAISSCAGAGLIAQSAGLPYQATLVLFGFVIAAGIIAQSVLWRSFKAGNR